jgi:succinate dehydrogenase cytochrome b556 subunit
MSPHLQVWRWHLTMLTSILHRATGMALYGGALIVTAWALALGAGPDGWFWSGSRSRSSITWPMASGTCSGTSDWVCR